MQRRDFIKMTSGFTVISILPINLFSSSVIESHQFTNGFSGNTKDKDITKLMTQTINVKSGGLYVKIHGIQTGTCAIKESHRSNAVPHFLTPFKITFDTHFTEFLPIWCWVIEHPEGVIVIDTGENAKVMNPDYFNPAGKIVAAYNRKNIKFQVEKENEIGFQLQQLGISKDKIKNVVLTHLHLDHTDGLKDFEGVEILANKDEYKNPSGHIPELYPKWFKPNLVSYRNDMIDVFGQAYPITEKEDVLLIPTNGHTHHHASVLFKTDEFDILFAGDVSYSQNQLLDNDLPGINVNYKSSKKTYDNILKYAQNHKLIYLPSHDENALERLKGREFLKSNLDE